MSRDSKSQHTGKYVKDPDGVWRFADSGIAVPGARDLTLSERFRPKSVLAEDGQTVERIIVSGDDIRREPELLGWCLEQGARLENSYGKVIEVLVPFELWQERDHVPGAIYAPEEHSLIEAEREVARVERMCREAERELQAAADARAKVLRRYAHEMTRQEAREITGLSIGRIQQLIGESRGLTPVKLSIMRVIGPRTGKTMEGIVRGAQRRKLKVGQEVGRRIRELEHEGLVERDEGNFLLTAEGRKILAEELGPEGAIK